MAEEDNNFTYWSGIREDHNIDVRTIAGHTPVYPKVKIAYEEINNYAKYRLSIQTRLRIKHKGKWYLQDFYHSVQSHLHADVIKGVSNLHSEVYKASHIGKVNLDIRSSDGKPAWGLDDNQDSEEERLRNNELGL